MLIESLAAYNNTRLKKNINITSSILFYKDENTDLCIPKVVYKGLILMLV